MVEGAAACGWAASRQQAAEASLLTPPACRAPHLRPSRSLLLCQFSVATAFPANFSNEALLQRYNAALIALEDSG